MEADMESFALAGIDVVIKNKEVKSDNPFQGVN